MSILRFLPRYRGLEEALRRLESHERWSREAIESHQLARVNTLWHNAVRDVPYYGALRRQNRLPATFTSLREFAAEVPELPREHVRNRPDSLRSRRLEPGRWLRTGGSTGTPTRVYWSSRSHRASLHAQYRFRKLWGIDVFDRTAMLWGHAASFAPGVTGLVDRARRPAEDWFRKRLRLSAYRLGDDDLRGYLGQMARFRPTWLYAYSSAAYLLARAAEAEAAPVPPLKAVVVTAEPAPAFVLETIETGFGCPALVEYGSVDCGFLAYTDPDRSLRVREDRVILETVPEGDLHAILVTVLDNPSFPLIRYRIGDVVAKGIEKKENGFGVLEPIRGRTNDALVTRTGRRVHPESVTHVLKQETDAIAQFQARQSRDGAVVVYLKKAEPQRQLDATRLIRKLGDLLEGQDVRLEPLDELPKTPGGKHRWVISELADHDSA
jgi:phenylacetate-CoA ligase